jgi:hypothetical protein
MKTVFRAIALACLCMSFQKVFAQPCGVTDLGIAITNVNPSNCVVTFDLSFTASFNSGNKHAVVHLWEDPSGGYPASITYPATAAATAQAKGTLVIKNPGTASPSYEPTYPISLGSLTSPYLVPTNFKWSDVNGERVFTFIGLQVTLSSCATIKYLKGDVYATQNDQNASGGCVSRNALNLAINDPAMRGLMICSNPRAVTVSFSTLSATSITFQAFRDVEPLGLLDENDKLPANQLTLTDGGGTSASKTVSNPAQPAGQYTNYGPYTYLPQDGGSQFNVWLVARAGANDYDNIFLVENTCSILPVVFESFNVSRESSNSIALRWTTTKEQNNAGFYVERKAGSENWRTLSFVSSKANAGTSGEKLVYEYNDGFNYDGVIQYRLRQVDLDGRARYSEIKAVKNSGQGGEVSVFPNPSKGGNFSVILSGSSLYSVDVIDGNGRVISHFTDVKGSKSITGLRPGQYLVVAENQQTGARASQKIIVQ